MIDFPKSPPVPPAQGADLKQRLKVTKVAHASNEEHQEASDKPPVERRRRSERRTRDSRRGPYDMRSGYDRRKNNGDLPSVDTDA